MPAPIPLPNANMLCQHCLSRLSHRPARDTTRLLRNPPRTFARTFSHSRLLQQQARSAVTTQDTTATNPRPGDVKPAATSTSAAQPFSTPATPSPANEGDLPIQPRQTKTVVQVRSSVVAGTSLKGLNFMKDAADPIALPDEEYPAWLWGVLGKSADGSAGGSAAEAGGDLFSKSKKQRRIAAKAQRKLELANPGSTAPSVPLHAQTTDLPRGDGSLHGAQAAGQARAELTHALRDRRRKLIKEDNFLREMA